MNWRPETIEEHILALERDLEEVNSSDEWEFINNNAYTNLTLTN